MQCVLFVLFDRFVCVRTRLPINTQGGYLPYTEWDFVKNICKEKGASNKKWDCVLCDGKYSGGPARMYLHSCV